MKTKTHIIYPAIAIVAVACVALSPMALAVSPAPDGGYPGGNTAEGDSALLSLTTGAYNTAVGFASLRALTAGNLNTATGADTLLVNTANENTATGAGALLSNTTGESNTANGAFALESNTTGNGNTAIGYETLLHNNGGEYNTANGYLALVANRSGFNNTAIGDHALADNNIGDHNTAVGSFALNAYVGNGTGGYNTAVGSSALANDSFGMGNTAVGAGAGFNVSSAGNVICIGAAGNNVSNSCYIGNIFGATSSGGTAVVVNSNGRLGTSTSSRRFKEQIKPMARISEALFSLQPVMFRYKKETDPEGTNAIQFGLLAEDVERVNPDLIVRDKEGKPYSVRYDQVNAMLLNEFLKAHRKTEEQQATITELKSTLDQQQKEMEALAAHLTEQDLKIQKLTVQVEAGKSVPQVVANEP